MSDATNTSRRLPIISGNWKMNLNHFEALQTVQKLHYLLESSVFDGVDVTVHPPFTDLRTVQTAIESDDMKLVLGAQNCHQDVKGAFTGEVSPAFLEKLNVSYVIIGHSERRELFGESDEVINAKVKAVIKHNMTPIMCVGETLDQRESGEAEAIVLGQVQAGLQGVKKAQVADLVIAYEPVWAIGTGKTATAEDAQQMCAAIRNSVRAQFSDTAADAVRIQYGGSVKPSTTEELMSQPDVDGALVGGASLVPEDFARIAQFASLSK